MRDTILLVEDDKSLLDSTAELLELAGYNVITAENGKDGLVKAKKFMPNLILCDVKLPELDGYGVLRAVEQIPELSGTPFIFATGDAGEHNFRKGMDLGADDYLVRPIGGEELLHVVAARLNKNRKIKKMVHKPTMVSFNAAEAYAYNHAKKMGAREFVFTEGDYADSIFYVKSGKIKTFKTNALGKDYITGISIEGEFFGYAILQGLGHFTESAVTLEPSEIGYIPKSSFFELLNSDHAFSLKLIGLLSDCLSSAKDQLINLAYNSVRKRVADALLLFYNKYDCKRLESSTFHMNREDISALAGTSAESVSRILTEFKERNIIEVVHGYIKIIDRQKLENMKN